MHKSMLYETKSTQLKQQSNSIDNDDDYR